MTAKSNQNMFNKNSKEIVDKVNALADVLHAHGEIVASLITSLDSHFTNIEKQIEANSAWLKEFHRLAIAEYTGSPKKRVYAFLYTKNSNAEHMLIITARDKFEDAQASALISLTTKEAGNVSDWTMQAYKSLDIAAASVAVVDKTEKLMTFEKPIDVYLHELELARDRWATGAQKKVMDAIISKVKKEYNKKDATVTK